MYSVVLMMALSSGGVLPAASIHQGSDDAGCVGAASSCAGTCQGIPAACTCGCPCMASCNPCGCCCPCTTIASSGGCGCHGRGPLERLFKRMFHHHPEPTCECCADCVVERHCAPPVAVITPVPQRRVIARSENVKHVEDRKPLEESSHVEESTHVEEPKALEATKPAEDRLPDVIQASAPVPEAKGSAAPESATIVVTLPADATLTVDGRPTTSTSATRVFDSPPLQPGQEFAYVIQAEVVRGGKTFTASKRVVVHAGQNVIVPMSFPENRVARK